MDRFWNLLKNRKDVKQLGKMPLKMQPVSFSLGMVKMELLASSLREPAAASSAAAGAQAAPLQKKQCSHQLHRH